MSNHIIFCSGGLSSFSAAEFVKTTYPDDNIVLYFTDVHWENEDLYRFINEVSDKLKLPLLTHSTGLNPIELMFERKMIYNSMIADCSKMLKMRVAEDFLKKGIKPAIEQWRNKQYLKKDDFITDATLYFGIGFEEMHRQEPIKRNWKPFHVRMPHIEYNIDSVAALKKYNIKRPILYDLGFTHNNCNGRCVKGGQGHFKNLKKRMPEVFKDLMEREHHLKICVSAYRYITNEDVPVADRIPPKVKEEMLRELDDAYRDYFYGRAEKPKLYIHPAISATCEYLHIQQYSFMKRKGDKVVERTRKDAEGYDYKYLDYANEPYPLRDFHYDEERKPQQVDIFDLGGCGCFVD